MTRRAVASAPASVGNVAVGFDVLGCSFSALHDTVSAERIPGPRVRIAEVRSSGTAIPTDTARNTAGVAVSALIAALRLPYGFELTIDKGIPFGSGLGGSAASAVAAVVAANALVEESADDVELLKFAMAGEAASSGAVHGDNVAPSLYGGLVLTVGIDDPIVTRIPVPAVVRLVVVHPHLELTTRAARQILTTSASLSDVIWQQANLAGFVAGCFRGDLRLIRASLQDVLIEPQRKKLIPGFDSAQAAAREAGALGCSISGGGPSLFALCEVPQAERVRGALVDALHAEGIDADSSIWTPDEAGARVIEKS